NECPECSLSIQGVAPVGSSPSTAPQLNINVGIDGSGELSFVAPASAMYQVYVANDGSSAGMLTAISITTVMAQTVELTQTLTTYSTTGATQYSQATFSPYTLLGAVASVVILILLLAVVVLSVLFDRGIIAVSTKRRKKRNP